MARRLIIGYDGSEGADDALVLGEVLAPLFAASALVVSVLPYGRYLRAFENLARQAMDDAVPLLETARGRLEGVEVETRSVLDESAGRALHHLAEEEPPAAIVIGSSRHGPLGRVLLGSVGLTLLSGTRAPIAVASRGYGSKGTRRLERIAVAVNGTPESQAALKAAVELAERSQARVLVLGVVEPLELTGGGVYPGIDPTAYLRASAERMEGILEATVAEVPDSLECDSRLIEGEPAAALAAEASGLDLLVIGSRAYGPVRRVLLGSVSAQLMSLSCCPVLILPRTAADEPAQPEEAAP